MRLGQKAARGTIWVMGGAYAQQGIAFAANIALMRLLSPEDFGILTLAAFFLALGQRAGAFGFNHALIHRQDDLDRAIPTHLFLHASTSALVLLLCAAASPLIAMGYDRITSLVLVVLAASNIIQSIGNTPRILLDKELDFSPAVRVNVVSVFFSNGVGIIAAFFGMGVWALAIRQVVADLIATSGYFMMRKRAWSFLAVDKAMIRWYFRFGTYLWLAGIATFITLKFDDFLVGTLIDSETLGYYGRAYWLACLPTTMIAHLIARVAFPVYSKLQEDRGALSTAFENAMTGILFLTLPASVGLALLAPELTLLMFGEKWMPMVPYVRLLLLYASLRPLFDNTGELFTAIGKPKTAGWILMAQAGALLLLLPPFVYWGGASGAAISVGLVMFVGVVLAYHRLTRYVTISYLRLFGPPAIAAIFGTAAVVLALAILPAESVWGRFFAKGLIFVAAYTGVLYLMQGKRLIKNATEFFALAGRGKQK